MRVTDKQRCGWARGSSELMLAYHDHEWGRPQHDDRALFELLTLEGAQAGLSWNTILNKREGYKKAFDNFEIAKVARYSPAKIERLMADAGIVRNRLKIESTVSNAKAVMAAQKEFGSFDKYVWGFVGGKPIVNSPRGMGDFVATSAESDAMSKAMRKRGFRFVGSTILYAFIQATGMVDDHEVGCWVKNDKPANRQTGKPRAG
jgi:DNA-3-methyladenine glycosylase I